MPDVRRSGATSLTNGSRVDSGARDRGTSVDLELNSWIRAATFSLRSISKAVDATKATTVAALAMTYTQAASLPNGV